MVVTNILKTKGDWTEVLNDCRFTANKGDLPKEPSSGFKRRILLSEHSPIRDLIFKWEWDSIPTWVSTHWVRHKWEKYVRTQREDRTNVDRHSRPQDAPVDMRGEANTQNLIDSWRKRLCYMASPETRECANSFKKTIHDEVDPYIADVLVPNCIYRSGCPEENPCGFFDGFNTWVKDNFQVDCRILSIQERYDLYNKYFYDKIYKG